MENQKYVCAELSKNLLGGYDCKKWVAYQIELEPQQIHLTKAQTQEMGGILVLFFSALVGYFMITKALKMA